MDLNLGGQLQSANQDVSRKTEAPLYCITRLLKLENMENMELGSFTLTGEIGPPML